LTSRKAFSVSLAISAVRAVVVRQSPRTKVRYSSAAASAQAGVMPPMMRSFSISSCMMRPGSTRSGQCATRMSAPSPASWGKLRSGRASASQAAIASVAPTGEVDSRITRLPLRSTGATERAAARIKLRSGSGTASGSAWRLNGVGTAIKNASAGSGSVVACRPG